MTDEKEERLEFIRRLFGTKPKPPDPDATEAQKFAHNLFNRDND